MFPDLRNVAEESFLFCICRRRDNARGNRLFRKIAKEIADAILHNRHSTFVRRSCKSTERAAREGHKECLAATAGTVQ